MRIENEWNETAKGFDLVFYNAQEEEIYRIDWQPMFCEELNNEQLMMILKQVITVLKNHKERLEALES